MPDQTIPDFDDGRRAKIAVAWQRERAEEIAIEETANGNMALVARYDDESYCVYITDPYGSQSGLVARVEQVAEHHDIEEKPMAEETRWQLIETAPKDGTRILLHDVAEYTDGRVERFVFTGAWDVDQYYGARWLADDLSWRPTPTHWMPLSCPPP